MRTKLAPPCSQSYFHPLGEVPKWWPSLPANRGRTHSLYFKIHGAADLGFSCRSPGRIPCPDYPRPPCLNSSLLVECSWERKDWPYGNASGILFLLESFEVASFWYHPSCPQLLDVACSVIRVVEVKEENQQNFSNTTLWCQVKQKSISTW